MNRTKLRSTADRSSPSNESNAAQRCHIPVGRHALRRVAVLTALAFDYRHFGDSDGTPRQLLDIAHQLEDWQAAIAYARATETPFNIVLEARP
jgi:hypothetical protein